MKKASLEHYRRKKFFYRMLMRSSPRSGGIFGIGLILFAILLKPLWIWELIRLRFIGEKFFYLGCGAVLLLVAAMYFAGAVFGAGLGGRDRQPERITTIDFWRRRWHQALMIAAAKAVRWR